MVRNRSVNQNQEVIKVIYMGLKRWYTFEAAYNWVYNWLAEMICLV